jgi:hypothetical protein
VTTRSASRRGVGSTGSCATSWSSPSASPTSSRDGSAAASRAARSSTSSCR